jgi:hypothetical protein
MARTRPKADLIPAENYPPLLPRTQRIRAMVLLRSSDTISAANNIIAMRAEELRSVVVDLGLQMKAAVQAADWAAVYAASHEIRGLAGTAGLHPTGEMANGFCHYLDAVAQHALTPEAEVVRLHLDAITRSARTKAEGAIHGKTVVQELSELVAHKLARIKDSETP